MKLATQAVSDCAESIRQPAPGWITPKRVRLYSIPLVMGLLVAGALFRISWDQSLWEQSSAWLPYGQWPAYGDLAVTLQHLQEAAQGEDPLSDPTSEFAYPRAVLALHHFGLQDLSVNWLGFLQNIAVVIGIVALIRPRSIPGAFACGLLFVAPPMVLGFERANLDFLLFLMCAVAGITWARATSLSRLGLPISALIAAAVMKLHPVFALVTAAVLERGRRRLVWLAGLGLLLGYWALTHADFALIGPKLPVTAWGSWGCLGFFLRLDRYLSGDRATYTWVADTPWNLVALGTYALLGVAAYLVGRRLARTFGAAGFSHREVALYWIGAAICCGSFAGANIAYRWIFVLLTLPLLLQSARAEDRRVATWGRLAVVAIAVSLAVPLNAHRHAFLIAQFANWSCILLLIVGGAALQQTAFPAVRATRRQA